jgi:hypothetical protein
MFIVEFWLWWLGYFNNSTESKEVESNNDKSEDLDPNWID